MSLPRKIVVIENKDKTFTENWESKGKDPDLLNIPHSFRMCVCGMPGSGKTTNIINIILHQIPEFQQIFIFHANPEGTKEYSCLWETENCNNCGNKMKNDYCFKCKKVNEIPDGVHFLEEFPAPQQWKEVVGDKKSICIIDDYDLNKLDKLQRSNLNRLFGYVSTHQNLSVIVTNQILTQVPCDIRRQCSFFIIYKTVDLNSMRTISSRVGLRYEKFLDLFNKHIKRVHDSLWIDLTNGSPAPLRLNGYEIIQ